MHVSYSGVITPYIYNCPKAHYFRNVQKVRIEVSETTSEHEGPSRRELGIQNHELLSQYLKQETEEFPYLTDTIEYFKERPTLQVEEQFFFDTAYTVLNEKPTDTDFISIRPDAFSYHDGFLELVDWKFANPDFGAAKYYGELEFFLAGLSAKFPDTYEAYINIHFPEVDYSLPKRYYSTAKLVALQQKYIALVDKILNDKLWLAKPAKSRCSLCNYRSQDAGGAGCCEWSIR